jgi:diamine N-acetyltransferase
MRRTSGARSLMWAVMRPNLSLRAARLEDAACLAALAAQSWLHTYATEGIRPTIARYVHEYLTPDAFRLQVSRTDAVTTVAEIDEHLVGYAVLELASPCPIFKLASAHLDKLYVQEHFLGQGIGFTLLQSAKAEAGRRGDEAGIWLTVNSLNGRARAFYSRQGFSDIGHTHFDLYGEKHENRILHAPVA